jgi:glycine/D-amino acid oxidase-like deaminating enzyme
MIYAVSVPTFRPPSFWFAALDETVVPRAPLDGQQTVDVAIVGAGYTGLWAAYYLLQREPSCRIAIVESEVAGFGASGRNGGWCSSYFPGIDHWLSHPATRERGIALQRALFDTVEEVGRASEAAGIDCDYARGGMLIVATGAPQLKRLRAEFDAGAALGFPESDFRWLDAAGTADHARIAGARAGIYSPHCAAIQPAKLARGLASFLEKQGVVIYEQSPVRSIAKGEVTTDRGRLHATSVLRCTEGYTSRIRGLERASIPLHSMMVATEPLSDEVWKDIGLNGRETFADNRRTVTYGQRTADGRLAFGARGLYYYGSEIRDYFDSDNPYFDRVHRTLLEFFPSLAGVEITHRWGGALAVPRDRVASVRFDPATGLGSAGGYSGNGVAVTNLAGRTLAELATGKQTELSSLPWVNHQSPNWEPEPLRWIGAQSVRKMADASDRAEKRGRSAGLRGSIVDRLSPH